VHSSKQTVLYSTHRQGGVDEQVFKVRSAHAAPPLFPPPPSPSAGTPSDSAAAGDAKPRDLGSSRRRPPTSLLPPTTSAQSSQDTRGEKRRAERERRVRGRGGQEGQEGRRETQRLVTSHKSQVTSHKQVSLPCRKVKSRSGIRITMMARARSSRGRLLALEAQLRSTRAHQSQVTSHKLGGGAYLAGR